MARQVEPDSAVDGARLGVVGLGYVGLPLAVEFGRQLPTVGFDIKADRIRELQAGRDRTLEVEPESLAAASLLRLTDKPADLAACNVYIVTVPTPVDAAKQPDMGYLREACRTVGALLKPDDVVVFESTVYPGCTEEVCVPILERHSGLSCAFGEHHAGGDTKGFSVGYSPERINPGDKEHRLTGIRKITSGSNPVTAALVDALYARIITAGTHPAPSIRVAEAAKVIENTQRDVNIALVNELAMLFNRMGVDTQAVLEAAGTKWNFLPFRPGLVGGHCIGVDPYYLTYKAQTIGHHPEMILAGRRINDGMGAYVAGEVAKRMLKKRIAVPDARILVLGLTFKENCPDLRNTHVVDVIRGLEEFGSQVDVYDPWVDPADAAHEYGITPVEEPQAFAYDAVILAVAHRQFEQAGIDVIRGWAKPGAVIYDIKGVLPREAVDGRL